jgi:hypothetical protein
LNLGKAVHQEIPEAREKPKAEFTGMDRIDRILPLKKPKTYRA